MEECIHLTQNLSTSSCSSRNPRLHPQAQHFRIHGSPNHTSPKSFHGQRRTYHRLSISLPNLLLKTFHCRHLIYLPWFSHPARNTDGIYEYKQANNQIQLYLIQTNCFLFRCSGLHF